MGAIYFLHDYEGDGFQVFATAEERDRAAEAAIEASKADGYWDESVFDIVCGVITHEASKVRVTPRPVVIDENNEDERGDYWPTGWNEKFDVEMLPVKESG